MAAAALPERWLCKNQKAPDNVAKTMTGDDNNEKSTEDPKFRFWLNNRGDNLSKRVENRTGGVKTELWNFARAGKGSYEVPWSLASH
jgi:hypothetical protein